MGVAERVDVEDVDICRSEEKVLDELARRVRGQKILDVKGLTEVNICHGSKKRKDMTKYKTYVERRDTIKVKNSWFLKRSATLKVLFLTSVWMEMTVMKIDANMRYTMIQHQKYTIVM